MLYVLFRSHPVQNWVCGKITNYLSEELHTTVSVANVDYELFNIISLQGLYIEDLHHDTLLYASDFKFKLRGISFDNHIIDFKYLDFYATHINLIRHEDASKLNYKFIEYYFSPPDSIPDTTLSEKPWKVQVEGIIMHDSRISYSNRHRPKQDGPSFDPNYIVFNHFNTETTGLEIVRDSILFDIQTLSLQEQSGLTIDQMSTKGLICSKAIDLQQLSILTPHSNIGNSFTMTFDGFSAFDEVEELVNINSHLERTHIGLQDIAYFSANLPDLTQQFDLEGDISGTISNLRAKNFRVSFGKHSFLAGTVRMRGLPDISTTFMDIRAKEAESNKQDLEYLLVQTNLPNNVSKLGQFNFTGAFTGFLKDFVAYGTFKTALGNIRSDVNMKIEDNAENTSYSGSLSLNNFNIGNFTQSSNYVGNVSFESQIKGNGLSFSSMDADLEGKVSNLTVNGYDYQNILVDGRLAQKFFTGNVQADDPNLKLLFEGTIDLQGEVQKYDFIARIDSANLKALKLDSVDAMLSTDVAINFSAKSLDNNFGRIDLSNLTLSRLGKSYSSEQITLKSVLQRGSQRLSLRSSFIDLQLEGQYSLNSLDKSALQVLYELMPNRFDPIPARKLTTNNFDFVLQLKDSRILTDLLLPELYFKSGVIQGNFKAVDSSLAINGNISSLQYTDYNANALQFIFNKKGGLLNYSIQAKNTLQQDHEFFNDIFLKGELSENSLTTHTQLTHPFSQTKFDLNTDLLFEPQFYTIDFGPSNIAIHDKSWAIDTSGTVRLLDTVAYFKDFTLSRVNESIQVNGYLGETLNEQLLIDVNRLDIGIFNSLLQDQAVLLSGVADGEINIQRFGGKNLISAAIGLDDFAVNTDTLGSLFAISNYNSASERVEVFGDVNEGLVQGMTLSGYFDTQDEQNALNFRLSLPSSKLKVIEPFVEGIFSDPSGLISANIDIKGSTDKPEISGSANISNAYLTVDYLNTRYSFNNTITFDQNTITFNKFTLEDSFKKTANIFGTINHDNFSDFEFDLNIEDFENLHVLNTSEDQNDLFYGSGYASGDVHISGTLAHLQFDINAKSQRGTQVFIPLSDAEYAGQSGMIRFVSRDTSQQDEVAIDFGGITLNCNLALTPDAELQLVFDSQLGDIIKGRGNANLRLEINPQGDFNMYGEYTIASGDYLFTAVNVINKRFEVSPGGTITWDGDPMKAKMDLTALYKLRAAPYDLLTALPEATRDAFRQRTLVECSLDLNGDLLAPDIRFGLNLPDINTLGTSNTSELNNVLQQLEQNPDEMNRQVFSLLLLNRFVPPTLNQNSNYTFSSGLNSGVNTSVGDLISNQVSNWLSQIDPNWDIGIIYQGVDEFQNRELILSLSRKFLNDRLEIEGSIDAENQTGNLSAQYSLTKDGQLKARVFSKNTNNPILQQNVLTQGAGLFYKKEFERFRELMSRQPKTPPAPKKPEQNNDPLNKPEEQENDDGSP